MLPHHSLGRWWEPTFGSSGREKKEKVSDIENSNISLAESPLATHAVDVVPLAPLDHGDAVLLAPVVVRLAPVPVGEGHGPAVVLGDPLALLGEVVDPEPDVGEVLLDLGPGEVDLGGRGEDGQAPVMVGAEVHGLAVGQFVRGHKVVSVEGKMKRRLNRQFFVG